MSDFTPESPFDHAFHVAAERHERAWVFLAIVLLAILFAGTLVFVVTDFGVVAKGAGFYKTPSTPVNSQLFKSGAVVQTGPKSYSAYVTGKLWYWKPSPIVVPKGSTVTFYVTSADVLHGFEIQGTTINLTVIPGVIGKMTYTFDKARTYHVICNEYCGLEHQAMLGEIIVTGSKK